MNISHSKIAKYLLTEEKALTISLTDLVGEFELSGVSRDNAQMSNEWDENQYEDCQIMSFILNGVTFTAVESPDDGYRSHMRNILVERFFVSNKFQPVKVYTIYRTNNNHIQDDGWMLYEECDILEFYDKENNKLIMRIGTKNTDSFYPYFVAEWIPENMAINSKNHRIIKER